MTDKILKIGKHYDIVAGSLSAHCCFDFTIVKKGWLELGNHRKMDSTVCECFDIKDAELVFNALESAAKENRE